MFELAEHIQAPLIKGLFFGRNNRHCLSEMCLPEMGPAHNVIVAIPLNRAGLYGVVLLPLCGGSGVRVQIK